MKNSLQLVHAHRDEREMYAEYLSAQGLPVNEAGTTHAALPPIQAAAAAITCLLLPGLFDGVELIVRSRRDARTAEKPVVVVTASTFSQQLERARRAGADVLLIKPCLPAVLLGEVQRLLASKAKHLTEELPA